MINIETFENLEVLIRDWTSFNDPYVYDSGGIVVLFAACLDNIKKNFLESEIEDFSSYLSEDQIDLLLKLAVVVARKNKTEDDSKQ